MIKQDESTQLGWGDVAGNIHETDTKYVPTKVKIPGVNHPQTADNAPSSGAFTVGEAVETVDSVPSI